MRSLLTKLRGRSLTELRVRAGQAIAARRERAGLAAADLAVDDAALRRRLVPDAPDDLLAAFRARTSPRFYASFDDPAATVAALRAHCPSDEPDVLARAERIVAHRFDMLGWRGLSYGSPIDWSLDPVANKRAPSDVHWSRVPYLDESRVGDHKVTWEVNRQQYLVTLGQAYWYTRDERWARAFVGFVTEWMDANPPKRGINWASSLEVAFRAISWTWALHLFRASPSLDEAFHRRMLAYLAVHAGHLERFLSTYFSPNTHLTGEALGLVHVGGFFPELRDATRWRDLGLGVLREWLPKQVRADGGYFEQATQYHRYTSEFFLHLLLLGERNRWNVGGDTRRIVERLYDLLHALMRADGTMPLLGDDDGGRYVQLDGGLPHELRPLLGIAGAALGRADLVEAAQGSLAPAIWLLGPEAATATSRRGEPLASRAFEQTGLYVMRSGDRDTSLHAVIDGGPHGVFNAGHAHADGLTLVASAGARHLLVDSGTYAYVRSARNAFRGASAHNVALVDGEGASVPAAGSFQWARIAEVEVRAWSSDATSDLFHGVQRVTRDGGASWTHDRQVLFLKGLGWLVRDRLRIDEPKPVTLRWHLAPGLVATPDEADGIASLRLTENRGRAPISVACLAAAGQGAWRLEEGWVSPQYGAREPATVAVWSSPAARDHDVLTFLVPTTARAPAVRAIGQDGKGHAFVMEGGDGALSILVVTDGVGAYLDQEGAAILSTGALPSIEGREVRWAVVDRRAVRWQTDEGLAVGPPLDPDRTVS